MQAMARGLLLAFRRNSARRGTMSETAQLLNLLVGVSASTTAPKAAHAGQAKPGATAAASDGFLALLALAGADANASANALAASLKTNAAQTQAKDPLAPAIADGSEQPKTPAQPASPEKSDAEPQTKSALAPTPLLSPSAATAEGLAALLAPKTLPETNNQRAADTETVVTDAARSADGALPAPAQPKIATPPLLPGLPQSSATNNTPSASSDVPGPAPELGAQVPSANVVAAGAAQQIAADLASSTKAEILTAATDAPMPAPTREAIVNASLPSVASALLGEKPSSPGSASAAQTEKPALKPAETPRPATSAPQSASQRDAAREPTAAQAAQASAQTSTPSDDTTLQSNTARVSSNANLAPAQEQAPSTDSAAPSQALAYNPAQSVHSAVPVIVVRAAQSADGPALPQDRIALAIVRQLEAGVSRFEIRLDPPELGRIDVKMSVRADGHVSAQLTADRPDTLELLQRDARVLQRALSDAGLTMDSGSLSFGLRDRGGRQVFDQDEASSSVAAIDEEDESIEALPYGMPLTASLEPGRVDLRI